MPYVYTFDYRQKRPRRLDWQDVPGCPYPGEHDFNGFVECLFPYAARNDAKGIEAPGFSDFSSGYDAGLLYFQTGDGKFHRVAIDHDHHCPRFYTAPEPGAPFEGDARNPYSLDWGQVRAQVPGDDIEAYFAYGADINFDLFRRRYGESQAKSHERAVLFDHRLSFSHYSAEWKGGVFDIQPAPGECVEGVIYRVGSLDTIVDRYGDKYEPVKIWVEGQNGSRQVTALIHKGAKKMFVKPAKRYVDAVLKGARQHEFTPRYRPLVERLKAGFVCSYLG